MLVLETHPSSTGDGEWGTMGSGSRGRSGVCIHSPRWELGEAQTPVMASDGAVGLRLLPSCYAGDILSGSIS